MRKNHYLLLSLFLLSLFQIKAITHPCLIVTKEMYPQLRASGRATSPLLKGNSGYAKSIWNRNVPATTPNIDYWAFFYACSLSANSLMYVQNYDDETLKSAYRGATINLINRLPEQFSILGGPDHDNTVAAAAAFVNAVIALDIMHDDFTATELANCDSIIDVFAQFFQKHVYLSGLGTGKCLPWTLSWKGANVVYYLYKDDKVMIPSAVNEYKTDLLVNALCSDGSWLDTPGYWHARLAEDRVAKWCAIDILSFMGYYDFYKDPRMIKTMDWCNSFSLTPWGGYQRLSETGTDGGYSLEKDGMMFRMGQWSDRAGANASWYLGKSLPATNTSFLFTYLLFPTALPAPAMPTSALFKYSGASLWDTSNSTEALQGVLYCPQLETATTTHEHSSDDVNSVSINAYGEYMIMNAGTNYYPKYPGKRPDGGTWNDAWMQNVVLVDGKTLFVKREGNGMTDLYSLKDADGVKIGHGLLGGMVEFAEADISVATTGNANHWRTLFSVKSVAGQSNGYFLLRDKVQSMPNKVVTLMLHPNSTTGSVMSVLDKAEYQGVINGFVTPQTDQSEKINVFYATAPDSVSIKQAWKASLNASTNLTSTNPYLPHNFLSDYLRSCYKTGANGYAKIATVLFPQDNLHTKASFSRITNLNYSGAQIIHNANCIDYFLVPNAAVNNLYNGYSFNGESVFYRTTNGSLSNYAVANGTKLNDGAVVSTGFSADNNISIEMDDKKGSVMTDGARVTFSYPGIKGVKLNNTGLIVVSSTANSMVVDIPAGKFALELLTTLPTAVFPTTISAQSAENALVVFCTAGTKVLTVLNKNQEQNNTSFELVLSNLQGKKVLTKSISCTEETNRIDLSFLPSGLYFWALKNEGKFFVGKVEVQ